MVNTTITRRYSSRFEVSPERLRGYGETEEAYKARITVKGPARLGQATTTLLDLSVPLVFDEEGFAGVDLKSAFYAVGNKAFNPNERWNLIFGAMEESVRKESDLLSRIRAAKPHLKFTCRYDVVEEKQEDPIGIRGSQFRI